MTRRLYRTSTHPQTHTHPSLLARHLKSRLAVTNEAKQAMVIGRFSFLRNRLSVHSVISARLEPYKRNDPSWKGVPEHGH